MGADRSLPRNREGVRRRLASCAPPPKKAGGAQAGSEGPSALRPMFAKLDQNVLWPQPQRTDGE